MQSSLIHFIQGVMMTHGNVLATVSAVMTIIPDVRSKDVYLAYLPLAHILELAAEVWRMCKMVGLCSYTSLISLFYV